MGHARECRGSLLTDSVYAPRSFLRQKNPCSNLVTLRSAFIELPRWLLLAVIVYAPWAYGCTRWWAKTLLIQSLLAITLLWLCSLFLRRRWPRVTVPAGVVALSLLGLGWFSVFNSLASYDELAQIFLPTSQALPGWPVSWDAAFSLRTILLVTALMGAFCISMDLAANPVWRRRLFFHACPERRTAPCFRARRARHCSRRNLLGEGAQKAHFLPHISITPTPAHSST